MNKIVLGWLLCGFAHISAMDVKENQLVEWLLHASRHEGIDEYERLLKKSPLAGVDWEKNKQVAKLMDAISYNRMDEFDTCMDEGVDHTAPYYHIDMSDRTLRCPTPIMWAIMYRRLEMGQKLLAKNPKKQIAGDKNGTLMKHVAFWCSHKFIPLLISHGAVVDEEDLLIARNTRCYITLEGKQKTINEMERILKLNKKQAAEHELIFEFDL